MIYFVLTFFDKYMLIDISNTSDNYLLRMLIFNTRNSIANCRCIQRNYNILSNMLKEQNVSQTAYNSNFRPKNLAINSSGGINVTYVA